MCSLDVNISVVHTTASDKKQERRQVWETRRIVYSVLNLWLIDFNLRSAAENNGQEQRQAW